MRNFLAGFIGFLLFFSSAAFAADNLKEGKEFRKTIEQQSIAPFEKQVIEVFYYGCSHCYNLEPSLEKWLKTKPANVDFKRIPAVLNDQNWIFMAKVYFTAEELGIIEKSHLEFFHALHRDKKQLFNLEAIAKFHSQFGATEQEFINTFKSFKIDQKTRQSQRLVQAYGLEGVPTLVVNGKYITDLTMNGGETKLWQTVNQLLEK